MPIEKVDGVAGEVDKVEAVPVAPAVEKKEAVDEIRAQLAGLEAAIAEQRAKGEITAASESTLQALYEELKLARNDLAQLKELRIRIEALQSAPTDKWAKWLPW